GLREAVCAQVRTVVADMPGLGRSAVARRPGVAPVGVRAVAGDLVVAGRAAGGVLAVAERGCVTVGGDLEDHRPFALSELVNQSAGLEPVGGRDEADAAAVGELLDVGELTWGSWVVGGHGAPPCCGARWSRGF